MNEGPRRQAGHNRALHTNDQNEACFTETATRATVHTTVLVSLRPSCGRVGSTLGRCLFLLLLSVRLLLVVWDAVPVAALPAANVDAVPQRFLRRPGTRGPQTVTSRRGDRDGEAR